MKRNLLAFSFVLLTIFCMVSDVSGIGISPARWPNNLPEYDCSFDSSLTYSLMRPSTRRYSQFSISNPAGLSGTITGCSASGGIEYLSDGSMIIDWQSNELLSLSSITASINVTSPEAWACPAEPGGDTYMADLVWHKEMVETDSGIIPTLWTVSQIAFYRNYAPKAYLQSSATTGLTANLGLQFEDKKSSWFSKYIDRDYNGTNPWFAYNIDWDGDGQTDQSGTAIFDEEPVPDSKYPSLFRWTSGIQVSTLSLEHVFSDPGNYLTMLYLTDGTETTTLQIPVNVTPEPATLALFGLGGLFLRKRKS